MDTALRKLLALLQLVGAFAFLLPLPGLILSQAAELSLGALAALASSILLGTALLYSGTRTLQTLRQRRT